MTQLRDFLITIGVSAIAVAVLIIAFPSIGGSLSLPQTTTVIIGFIALIQGFRSVQSRRHTAIDQASIPAIEDREATPIPGDDFDERIQHMRGFYSRGAASEEERIKQRLRGTAIDVLTRTQDISNDAARDQLDAGEWTNDPIAASFLGGQEAPSSPIGFRLQSRVSSESYKRRAAIRTTNEIIALWQNR